MYESFRVHRTKLFAVGGMLVAVAIFMYELTSTNLKKHTSRSESSIGDACPEPSALDENPDTTLFVGCGNYL